MNNRVIEQDPTTNAIREAERHRREIASTLDKLGERIQRTAGSARETREKVKTRVDKVERQLHKPLDKVQQRPWMSIGLAVLTGFLLAGSSSSRKHRKQRKSEAGKTDLEHAYLAGRWDERLESSALDMKHRGQRSEEGGKSATALESKAVRAGWRWLMRPLMVGIATGWSAWRSSRPKG